MTNDHLYFTVCHNDSSLENNSVNDTYDDRPSKSQNKREAEALQALGKQLVDLEESVLDGFPLTDGLRQAISDAKKIKSHGAMRRQAQLIGKLMRSSDHEAIGVAFAAIQAQDAAQTAGFHLAEQWRDKLINGGALTLSEFIDTFHPEDIQHLRHLIKKVTSAATETQQKAARKALFRYISPYANLVKGT